MTEAEQIEVIKKWWLRNQNWILICVSAIVIIVAGYRYWNLHVEKMNEQASSAYDRMMAAVSKEDEKTTQSYANQLIANDPHSVYAIVAHLTLAKVFVNQKAYDKAQSELNNVIESSENEALKQLANIRLARILIMQKQYDKALAQLAAANHSPFITVVNELQGDIYSTQGEYLKAKESYQAALTATPIGQSNLFLQMKNDAVNAIINGKSATQTV